MSGRDTDIQPTMLEEQIGIYSLVYQNPMPFDPYAEWDLQIDMFQLTGEKQSPTKRLTENFNSSVPGGRWSKDVKLEITSVKPSLC